MIWGVRQLFRPFSSASVGVGVAAAAVVATAVARLHRIAGRVEAAKGTLRSRGLAALLLPAAATAAGMAVCVAELERAAMEQTIVHASYPSNAPSEVRVVRCEPLHSTAFVANQDRWSTLEADGVQVCAVFDGHGEYAAVYAPSPFNVAA
jgi:hypothetical protein